MIPKTLAELSAPVEVPSAALGEPVIWCGDDIVDRLRLSPQREHLVVYTASELGILAAVRPNSQDLRALHEVKRAFGQTARIEGHKRKRTP